MIRIRIEQNAHDRLLTLGVFNWPVWTREVSEFPRHYDKEETRYFLEGEVVVAPEAGDPVESGKGDLVPFPKGMSCIWKIRKPVRKHHAFGERTACSRKTGSWTKTTHVC